MPANVQSPMPLPRPRWLASAISDHLDARSAARAFDSLPPSSHGSHQGWHSRLGRWLGASSWFVPGAESLPALGHRQRGARLAAARLEFAEALFDVRSAASATLLDRIAVMRSLPELWHLRGEVFAQVSRRHGQVEANDRLAALDGHFPKRMRRANYAVRAPLIGAEASAILRPHRRPAHEAKTG
jgi:hypothetical protein